MWAHFGLLLGAQAVLPWTWHSHRGGEEQALFGLIDHDDRPSWKLDEFAGIARDFAKLEKLGFPRLQQPQVAIAYSFDNMIATNPPKGLSNTVGPYIRMPYLEQAHNAYQPLFRDNVDVAVINVAHEDLERYKLVIVPGMYLLDAAAAERLRKFIAGGGTVVMTAQSDKVDEHNQWYDTPLPGRLSDVFGMRTNEFYDTGPVRVRIGGAEVQGDKGYVELLEPSTAQVLSRFTHLPTGSPAITVNHYGKGQAIYVGTLAQPAILGPLYRQLYASLGIEPGPVTPEGVFARKVAGRLYVVNTTGEPKDVAIEGSMNGLLSGKRWSGSVRIEPLGADLLE
jgi:beta-galactosidase